MSTLLLALFLLQPQLGSSNQTQQTVAAVRTEKLTSAELKQHTEAKTAVDEAESGLAAAKQADSTASDATAAKVAVEAAQTKLNQAKAELQGAEDGISLAHHANTDCGCYVQSQGREYDRVEFKDDTILIRHVHEGPPSLH